MLHVCLVGLGDWHTLAVRLRGGRAPSVRLLTAAARASGLQYPRSLCSVITSAGRLRYTIVLQTTFLTSRNVLVAANSHQDRCSGIQNRTEKPCADRGRAAVQRPPPQGSLWIFRYLPTVILPVRWRIPSRLHHSPHQNLRLTPSILYPAPLPLIYPHLRRWTTSVRNRGRPPPSFQPRRRPHRPSPFIRRGHGAHVI